MANTKNLFRCNLKGKALEQAARDLGISNKLRVDERRLAIAEARAKSPEGRKLRRNAKRRLRKAAKARKR